MNDSRKELGRYINFLKTNKTWLCKYDSCGLNDFICDRCRCIEIFIWSYKVNKQAKLSTLANLYKDFNELFYDN